MKIKPVDLGDRVLFIGTDRGVEPPITIMKASKAFGQVCSQAVDKVIIEAFGDEKEGRQDRQRVQDSAQGLRPDNRSPERSSQPQDNTVSQYYV